MAEEISAALENVAGAWDWSSGISFNTALVFIKPHAVNPQVQVSLRTRDETCIPGRSRRERDTDF